VAITTPTAKSTAFPRRINCLNPCNIYVVYVTNIPIIS
jgi:hypothetical protein